MDSTLFVHCLIDFSISFWETDIVVDLGFLEVSKHLYEWVNDGLMAVFFYVVGLEVKHEIFHGELSDRRRAALPVFAALGGMALPALLFIGLNTGGEGIRGWGIPVATDTAFALGVLAFLGRRIPAELRVFLLALAVVDDIAALAIVAIFYTESLSFAALGYAFLLVGVIVAMNRIGVHKISLYMIVGVVFWLAVLESGIHATIAGVVLGLLTPVNPIYHLNSFTETMNTLV
ncbi:MAG: Na+/H+ antiporter NhaA, partial [Gaiellaceae bacterium]